jgi:hypothetical protein
MRSRAVFLVTLSFIFSWTFHSASAVPVTQDASIEGDFIKVFLTPNGHGTLEEFTLKATGHDMSGGEGLLQEGFGVPSAYVPGRRLNEKLEIVESITDRPVLKYSYDCEGPNISGLHVERVIEPILNASSVNVKWLIEHRGKEQLWVSPWVRNDVVPGGLFEANDRIDMPALRGILHMNDSAYHTASRNWIAATDVQLKESVCAVFNANMVHSFLADYDLDTPYCAMQTAFVPSIMKPGDKWQTNYRVNIIYGLSHVDFASDELAAQLDYKEGLLEVRLASVKEFPVMEMEARIARGDNMTKLPAKRFQLKPGQVVRCSFPWSAPKPGAYEFYGRITVNGKQFKVGGESGSPEGLIDTQFVVGKTSAGDMDAWTNAPYALDRNPRTIRRNFASFTGGMAVWFESSLEKVFREDIVQPTGSKQTSAHIALAQNEHESFQVVVRPEHAETDVTVRASDLKSDDGNTISSSKIAVHNVLYYHVQAPSHFEGPTGDWPDALPLHRPVTLAAGRNAPFWITVYAPNGTAPGLYKGTITIASESLKPVEVGLEVTVYNFAIPAQPSLRTAFGFWPDAALRQGQAQGFSKGKQVLIDAYLHDALAHRVTIGPLASLPEPGADYAKRLEAFESRAKQLLAQGASLLTVPASLLDQPESLKLANAFIGKHGLERRSIALLADEPPPAAWEKTYQRVKAWKALAPSIPPMVTTFGIQPFLPEELNVWAVHLPMFDTANNVPILSRTKAGGDVWAYVNYSPSRPYGNFFIDFAAIEHRILFWHLWALGVRGMYYESINAAPDGRNPYEDLLDLTPTNGNGFLVYPGKDGPVDSIRWETIRDGIDDYDYLSLLGQLIDTGTALGVNPDLLRRAEESRNLQKIIPNLVSFTREPTALESKRSEMAHAIEELSTVLKRTSR